MDGKNNRLPWLRRLYDWVLHWAETPYGTWALFLLAFSEAFFFPVPPDLLLIALTISIPRKGFQYAMICSFGSLLGGMVGYGIGMEFMERIGIPILRLWGGMEYYGQIKDLYHRYDAWAVGIAGFTPIPYKVFTIAAGAFKIDFLIFLAASAVSRSARFVLVGGLIYFFGPAIKGFIDRYFNAMAVAFVILLLLGFVVLRWIF